MTSKADFSRLASELLNQSSFLLHDWLPGGKIVGNEFVCGNLSGVAGQSLKVNLRSGKWADFSSSERGGDLISLYAAIHRCSQIDAYKRLGGDTSPKASLPNGNGHHHQDATSKPSTSSLVPVPSHIATSKCHHKVHGTPTKVWKYHDGSGQLLFLVARYDVQGKKQIVPWSYCSERSKWVCKAWPEPRPLYNLHHLMSHPGRAVLVVEGEKAADAAAKIAGDIYCVVTWQGGSQAFKKTDWTPLHGRRVLLWPDADEPGVESMHKIAGILLDHCPEVKLINPYPEVNGWDAADALDAGMDWQEFKSWAKPRAHIYAPMQANTTDVVIPDQPPSAPIEVIAADPPDVQMQASDPVISHHAAWDKMGLAMTQKSGPIVNVDNVVRILEAWPQLQGVLWYDDFHQRILTSKDGDGRPREWRDVDDIDLCVYIQGTLGIPKMTTRVVCEAVELYAQRHRRNEPKDWLEGIAWDQSPRIEAFFVEAFGAEDTEYVRAASRNWWIAMAARIYQPGCKFDNMVVLEGPQGKFKSTALSVIGGDWFMEATETMGSKDFLQALKGKLVVEIGELDSFTKADIRTIKKTISCGVDTYRASYGRRSADFPRQCVFVGTTNEDEYLEDPTGGRRFWPIRIGSIDLDLIREHRNQLFAEAVHRFKAGESWWDMPQSAREEQEARRRVDAWEEKLVHWLSGRDRLKLGDIAHGCLGIEAADFDKRNQMRLGAAMRSIGWVRRTERFASRLDKVWVRGPDYQPAGGNGQSSIFEQQKSVKNFAPGGSNHELEH